MTHSERTSLDAYCGGYLAAVFSKAGLLRTTLSKQYVDSLEKAIEEAVRPEVLKMWYEEKEEPQPRTEK